MKTLFQKDTCTSMFTALFTVAKIWKQPKCPSADEWRKKCYIFVYNGILLNHKKEGNFAICKNIDGLVGYCAK